MTLINRQKKHSDVMTGRQRVRSVEVDTSFAYRPVICVHREDADGEIWNYSYRGQKYVRRGRQMQDIMIESMGDKDNDE